MRYVALLRGVNVGTATRVPMSTLKYLLEDLGFENVTTYLNSGNAIFDASVDAAEATRLIEDGLQRAVGQRVPTLVKTAAEMSAIAAAIPADWANDQTQQTYVAYLFADVDGPELIETLPVRMEYLTIFHTPGAIVWNIRRENYNKSHITKIAGHPAYARMTTRNVNSARKLAALAEQA